MTDYSGGPLDDALVETLLSLKKDPDKITLCKETALLAEVLAGDTGRAKKKTMDAHLSVCSSCREVLLIFGQLAAAGELGPLPDLEAAEINRGPTHPGSFLRRRWIAAAAALILATAGTTLFLSLHHFRKDQPKTTLFVKGDSDSLFVAVQRGVSRYTLQPMDTLREGDVIGLFYSAKADGYLAVFGVDSNREATLIYPANHTQSAPMSAAERAPLPDGATMKSGTGCEWLVGVFSDVPLDLEGVSESLRRGAEGATQCDLKVQVHGARSVQIVPFLI